MTVPGEPTYYPNSGSTMNSDEFFHYHLRPRGMMRVEKYEKYDFQPLVRVGYQGMQKRYETKILILLRFTL